MVETKKVLCPCCKNGVLEIEVENGYEVDFNKPLKEHNRKVICTNCVRTIRYSVKKRA